MRRAAGVHGSCRQRPVRNDYRAVGPAVHGADPIADALLNPRLVAARMTSLCRQPALPGPVRGECSAVSNIGRERDMRVLCSTTPVEGAFAPFVPLGLALVRAGHEVIVATGSDLQRRVAEQGFAGAIAGPTAMESGAAARADPIVQGASPGEQLQFNSAMFGEIIPARKLPALRELADAFAPDLVLHPPVDLAGPLLAAERRLPSGCCGYLHPLGAQVLNAMAERVAPLWEQAGLVPDPYAGLYRSRYLDPCPPTLRSDRGAAEPIAQPIRPEIPGDPQASLPAWVEQLGSRPTLYVSLGTVRLFNQLSVFQRLLEELVKEDIELVVTVSELHDPAALGELPPTAHVEQWLPLASILPRCDAVLCHAGTGTTLAALTAGLPLVLVPQGADQFTNAKSCQAAGVARALLPAEVTPTAVRDAVRSVLATDSAERAVAQLIAVEIVQMPPATDVALSITKRTAPEHHPPTTT